MISTAVAVVTGANKGIGFAIAKGLCEKFTGKVFLTARDAIRGKEAVTKLQELGFNPEFHQLDITNLESIIKFKDHIQETCGGIDVLINNAAIAYKSDATEPFGEQAEVTVKVNYLSTLQVCETLFPLLRKNGRVVNVSSSAGRLLRIPSTELRGQLSDPNLTVVGLTSLMNKFVEDAKTNKNEAEGWGSSAYVVSKVGVSSLTIIQQRLFDAEPEQRGITVNSVHPGYVDTDMTSHKGNLTIEEGAKAPLFLALEPHNLKGQYVWCDSKVVDWYSN